MNKILLLILFVSTQVVAQDKTSLEARIKALEDKIETREFEEQFKNAFSFSGQLLNHAEYFQEKGKNNPSQLNSYDSSDYKETVAPVLMRVALNMEVKMSSNLNFYTTWGMGKFWNNDGRARNLNPIYSSVKGSAADRGAAVYLDVAYIKYQEENSDWTFTMGRMSTNNGPPINQLDNLSRQGTYPRLGYNAILDGVGLIYKPNTDTSNALTYRFFYTPFIRVNEDSKNRSDTDVDADDDATTGTASNDKIKSNMTGYTGMIEYETDKTALAKNLKVYLMGFFFNGLYIDEVQYPEEVRKGIEYTDGNFKVLFLGLDNVLNSNFHASYSYLNMETKMPGENVITATAQLINLSYVFKNKYTLGTEYIHTDKNALLQDHSYEYVADYYVRPSNNGYHYYFSTRLSPKQIWRTGFFSYKAKKAGFPEDDRDTSVNSVYTQWRVFF